MVHVAGCDPGTSSLDILTLLDGRIHDQVRFPAEALAADPDQPVAWLRERGPFDLIAGPSGYGAPLIRAADCTTVDRDLMTLVRADERGRRQGVSGFSSLLESLCRSGLPMIFLPGVIHLPTIPAHRKLNRIDLGTSDKLCVAALALERWRVGTGAEPARASFAVVELGSAFAAILIVDQGRIVDGLGGTSGPMGWRSGGAWDGELAYLLSPLTKEDLFRGGVMDGPDPSGMRVAFRERLLQAIGGLQAVTPVAEIYLSGRLVETEPELRDEVIGDLSRQGQVSLLPSWDGVWVKAAAQGSALLADGLAGGSFGWVVESLQLRGASGSVWDQVIHPSRKR